MNNCKFSVFTKMSLSVFDNGKMRGNNFVYIHQVVLQRKSFCLLILLMETSLRY